MRKILLALLFICFSCYAALFAQNKTLGVGVTAPNPNAALHVESPTGNQGFIMPRLTTVQREAMTSFLTDADKGLILYDTDLNTIYIWNGLSWQNTGEVSGRGYFEVNDPASTALALYATTNSNADVPLPPVAIYGESTGTGASAGSFRINNAENNKSALYAETLGTGISIMGVTSTGFSAIQGQANGGFSNGVSGISNSPDPGSYAVLGQNNGGGPAGVFSISTVTNTSHALEGRTSGTGAAGFFEQTEPTAWTPAVLVHSSGQGAALNATSTAASTNANAAEFVVQNPTNPRFAVMAETLGLGSAGNFRINNTSSTSPVISASTNGGNGSAAIKAEYTGGGNGFAGLFDTRGTTNTYPAIQASSEGTGSGLRVMQTTGTGAGVDVFMQNTSSNASGIFANQKGLGSAATFEVDNTSSPAPAIHTTSNGTGSVIHVEHRGTSGDAIYAENQQAGGNSAGNFHNTNGSNTGAAVYASNSAASGVGVAAANNANGVAFQIANGGMKVTALSGISTSSIPTRAVAYQITGGGTAFTLGFTPDPGEIFLVFNDTASAITFQGVGIPIGEGRTIVHFGSGVYKGL